MFAFDMMGLSLLAVAQVSGDFDGDQKRDAAAIVSMPDGSRQVIVTFYAGNQAVAASRVDEFAKLDVVSPAAIARACARFTGVVTACARNKQPDRDGLSFKPTREELPALALWNGAKFSSMFGLDLVSRPGEPAEYAGVARSASTPAEKPTSLHTVLELEIAETGRVANCSVVQPSGVPRLDEKACSLAMEKARYAPGSGTGTITPQKKRLQITWPTPR